jgi:uncharacterized protein (DUF885 family)
MNNKSAWMLIALAFAGMAGMPAGQNVREIGAGGDLEHFIQAYQTDLDAVRQFHDLPWSEARSERVGRLQREWRERLGEIDFDRLDSPGRVDYVLLRTRITADLEQLERERQRLAEMAELLPFRESLLELEAARRLMEPLDARAAASRVAAFVDQIKRVRERIEEGRKDGPASQPTSETAETTAESVAAATGAVESAESEASTQPTTAAADGPLTVSPVLAARAAGAVQALRGTMNDWFGFYDGYQPDFSWWLRKPYEEAGAAMDEYAKWLRETIAGLKGEDEDPLIGEPIGAAAIAEDIAAEFLAYSADELIAIGEREFAWCEAEMRKAAGEMGLGDDWKAALAKVKQDHVPPGEQDDLVTDLARESIRFLKDNNLLTIPPLCEETWRITMLSPETQKVLPFAAYGGQEILVAYPTQSMKHDDKLMSMRGNNRHFTRIVVPHELIPGHHMQAFMTQRHRPYRMPLGTPFFVEGWALYWEMTYWDKGYGRTPEDRIGMLFWRMHRAARIIVSLKFHLGRMTPQEMIDFLVDRVGHERFGATSEVRRYIGTSYSPLYQCAYMIGGLQLRALRREAVDAGRMSELQFHDALMTYGAIPIELIRADMLGVPLRPDSMPSWRFDER